MGYYSLNRAGLLTTYKGKLIYMNYLFDTNVLLKNPALLRDFHRDVVVSPTVFNELDYRKKFPEHQENAQLSIKHINYYHIKMLDRIKINGTCSNDAKILNEVSAYSFKNQITVVTDDEGLQVLAKEVNIRCISLASFQKEMMSSKNVPTEYDIKLFNIVKNGHLQEAEIFIKEHSFNPNFIGEDNLTPLIHFVRHRQFEKIKFWSSLPGCDLDKYDSGKFPMPPYVHSAQRGWLKGMKYLLVKGANPHLFSRGKNKGNSALLIAVWDGRLEIVKYLLESKDLQISINQVDGNGFTPIMKAAIKGHIEIASYLLKQPGIDLLIRDRDGKLVQDHAREHAHSQILKLINNYYIHK